MAKRWMKQKRFLPLLLSAAMLLSAAAPAAVRAEEVKDETESGTEEILYGNLEYTTNSSEDLPDNEELFAAYVDSLFFGDYSISTYGNYGESRLEGVTLAAYEALKEKIEQIAAGNEESTKIVVSFEDLGITQKEWTAADLGVNAIVKDGAITEEAETAFQERVLPDLELLLNYLLLDCPMDLYWFDKTKSVGTSFGYTAKSNGVEYVLLPTSEEIPYYFSVASEYSAETAYTVDTTHVRTAQTAVENAKDIVAEHADKADEEKLAAYKQEICDLVSYNTSAASNASTPYGNPWQLIWVFDNDDTTTVVCEGYSKAFQYLCDLSKFESDDVRSYIVSGYMNGGTGAGAHMWNVVTMDDKKNYIVDVTNCDTGSIGADDQLFLAAASGSAATGYTVACSSANVTYIYDDEMADIYGDILNISESRYCRHEWGEYTIDQQSTCHIEGSKSATCSLCGAKKTETIPKIEHSYGAWETVKEATCTEAGSRQRICTVCGETDTETIALVDHTLVKTDAKAATCTEAGNIAYYTCTVCGKLFSDAAGTTEISQSQTVIAKAAHSYQTVITKATVSANGSITEKCSVCGNVSKTSVIYYPQTIQLAKTAYTYTGKAITPAVTVKSSSGGTISAADYTVAYKNNKAVGTASVTITFRGNYTGTVTRTFAINPKGTSLKNLKASSKGFTASWKKLTSQTTGYEIQYGTSKNFKGAKILGIQKNKTVSAKVSKLKAKKTYYVRIRTYKKANGKKYYSAWSASKKIKTK